MMRSLWAIVGVLLVNSIDAQDFVFPEDPYNECSPPTGGKGQCVPISQCGPLNDILNKKQQTAQERELLRKSECGFAVRDYLVCCPLIYNTTPVPSTSTASPDIVDRASLLPAPGDCGKGNMDKVFGGNITRIDEYPWMVLLNYDKPGGRKGFHCGGVLINNRYVLTASHCVNGRAIPSDWKLSSVRLGEWDTNTETDCEEGDCNDPPVDISIEKSIPHEGYKPAMKSQVNDIALLRLSRVVQYTDWIRPICLPSASHLRSATFEGTRMDVAGWGRTEKASRSNVKLKASVDGVNLNSCQGVYRQQAITLEDSQLCAGGDEGIDSCSGDSGGPLIGFDNSMRLRPYFYAAGLVSFGPTQCGLKGWPGVYTRVGSYVDWIESHVKP